MNKLLQTLRPWWPHALCVALFVALSLAYFSPVMRGYVLPQMDDIHAAGASHELRQYHQATGAYAQWTDAMFGGMPAYQIYADSDSNVFQGVTRFIGRILPYSTVAILFLYLLGFYVLLLSLGTGPWIALAGAVAFALGSYNIIIIGAGHITKAYAIALMPAVVAGVVRIFRDHTWWNLLSGGLMTAIALGLEVAYNHVQITYYLALALGIFYIIELVRAIREVPRGEEVVDEDALVVMDHGGPHWEALRNFGLQTATLLVAVLLAILPGATGLWTTYEYGEYSIRGKSPIGGQAAQEGLDKDYALAWSYGIGETPTLLIPNVVGGASQPIGSELKSLRQVDPQIRQAVAQQSAYWGGRGFTSGPVYAGAIVCFLFWIGCFFYRGQLKLWLIIATVLSILLAWGKNFPPLTDLFFNYFPLYNKFRTVEMALVIASLCIPLMGFLGLRALYEHPEDVKYHLAKFFGAIGLTAGVALVVAFFGSAFYDFESQAEAEQFAQLRGQNPLYGDLELALIASREELCRADALRSAMLILLASSALWFASVQKINTRVMLATLAVLTAIDLWGVDRRYLNSDNFVPRSQSRNFQLSEADKACLDDQAPHRVMALYTNPFNEVYTAYYHRSVGGYHGAKLRRYQDVIDEYLTPEWQRLSQALRAQDYAGLDIALKEAPALRRLACKYLIYNPSQPPLVNHYAQGPAWWATHAEPANAEKGLQSFGSDNPANCHVEGLASPFDAANDSTASITQTLYQPNRIEYDTHNPHNGFAIFSEVYYPAGWKATIDGEPTTIYATDYLLRGLLVPAGDHHVVFDFAPDSYRLGKRVAAFGSVALVLLLLAAIMLHIRRKLKA